MGLNTDIDAIPYLLYMEEMERLESLQRQQETHKNIFHAQEDTNRHDQK